MKVALQIAGGDEAFGAEVPPLHVELEWTDRDGRDHARSFDVPASASAIRLSLESRDALVDMIRRS